MPSRRRSLNLPMRESLDRRSVTIDGLPAADEQNTPIVQEKRRKSRLIVGIDYGTTYTSVAYKYIKGGHNAVSGSLDVQLSAIEAVASWPGITDTQCVPTVTLYDSAEQGSVEPKWWGYQVAKILEQQEARPTLHEVHLAKLLLHEARETHIETHNLRQLAEGAGKDETDLIRDFLRCIHKYLFGENGYFQEHHSSWLVDTEIDFIIGVPPAWSEAEQQVMIQTAIEAGITNPSRGSEPEAMAAIFFAQHELSLEIGDTYLICDAGGGTVDLIAYTVVELNPLRVDEASVAEGVLCGSTYLNRRLRDLLERKLETEHYLRNLDDILNKATARFDRDFKKTFNGEEGEFFMVPGLREDRERGFTKNRIWLSSIEMCTHVFDPIVGQIKHMIRQQIEFCHQTAEEESKIHRHRKVHPKMPFTIKNIILGGGLGSNRYLSTQLKRAFHQPSNPGDMIEVQTLNSVNSTVAKGLVLLSLRYGMIKQRRSRLSYGLFTYVDHDEELHGSIEDTEARIDQLERGEARQIQVIDWLVRKGQPVSEEQQILRERIKNIKSTLEVIVERIFVCDYDTAGVEYTLMKYKPQNCEEYKIETDISMLPKDDHFFKPEGRRYYVASWETSLAIKNNQMIWSVALISEQGYRIVTKHSPLFFDAVPSSTKILGSLASRWAKVPVRPRSEFPRKPIFSKKRTRCPPPAEAPRKSSRLEQRQSPDHDESDSDGDYEPSASSSSWANGRPPTGIRQ